MGTLYLVRHGQASFGAEDYDQLSALGHGQCVKLGEYWRARGLRFDAVLTGSLRRHAQSFAGIAEGLAEAAVRPPSTLGRWRDEKSDTVRGLHDIAGDALARFGYL